MGLASCTVDLGRSSCDGDFFCDASPANSAWSPPDSACDLFAVERSFLRGSDRCGIFAGDNVSEDVRSTLDSFLRGG